MHKQSSRDVRLVCGTAILLAEPLEEDTSLELAPTTTIITGISSNIIRSLELATAATTTTTNSSNSNSGGSGGSSSGNSSNAATSITTITPASVPVNTTKKGVVRKGNTKQKKIMSANVETVRRAGEEKKGAVPKQSSRVAGMCCASVARLSFWLCQWKEIAAWSSPPPPPP